VLPVMKWRKKQTRKTVSSYVRFSAAALTSLRVMLQLLSSVGPPPHRHPAEWKRSEWADLRAANANPH